MLRALLAQLRAPSMIVAVLALVLSATGGAFAAKLITGAQIRNGTVSERDLSAAVRKKLARAGSAGPRGPVGAAGPSGAPGTGGAQGPAGSPDGPADIVAKLVQADGPGSGVDADTLDGLQGADLEAAGADRSLTLNGGAWLPARPEVSITERFITTAILRASGPLSGQTLAVLPLPLPSRIGDRRLYIVQITVCNSKVNDGVASAVTGTGFRLDAGDEASVGSGASLAPHTDIDVVCPSTTLNPTGMLVDDGKFSSIELVGSTTATTAQVLSRVTVRYRYAPILP